MASGDTTWFATFRMKVLGEAADAAAVRGGSTAGDADDAAAGVDDQRQVADQAGLKQANAWEQCRKIYDTALAQLHQQRGIALVGTTAKLLARRKLVAATRATVA